MGTVMVREDAAWPREGEENNHPLLLRRLGNRQTFIWCGWSCIDGNPSSRVNHVPLSVLDPGSSSKKARPSKNCQIENGHRLPRRFLIAPTKIFDTTILLLSHAMVCLFMQISRVGIRFRRGATLLRVVAPKNQEQCIGVPLFTTQRANAARMGVTFKWPFVNSSTNGTN